MPTGEDRVGALVLMLGWEGKDVGAQTVREGRAHCSMKARMSKATCFFVPCAMSITSHSPGSCALLNVRFDWSQGRAKEDILSQFLSSNCTPHPSPRAPMMRSFAVILPNTPAACFFVLLLCASSRSLLEVNRWAVGYIIQYELLCMK